MRLYLRRLRAKRMRWMALGLAAVAIVTVATVVLKASQDRQPDQQRSLLQTLAKWQYPGSTMLDGASMSDGGNPTLQSVKCKCSDDDGSDRQGHRLLLRKVRDASQEGR